MPGVTFTTNLSVLAATHNSLWCTPNCPGHANIAMQNLVVMRPSPDQSEEQAGREVGYSHARLPEDHIVLSRTCKGY